MAVCLMAIAVPEAYAAGGSKPAKVKVSSVKSPSAFTLTVKVKKAKRAKGYQYLVSTRDDFSAGVTKLTTKKRKATFTGLEGNREYYVKVRAYRKAGGKKQWGKWSAVKVKAVKGGPMNNAPEPVVVTQAVVSVRGFGSFTITLDSNAAPLTVANFCALADRGFYNGLTFHRIQEGFVIQGGDPKGDGTGGSGTAIKGEFSANGVSNSLADNFYRGMVAMARTGTDYNSATSQFFVTLSNSAASSLNGKYAAFGTVDENGMKVIDAIVAARKDAPRKNSSGDESGVLANDADKPVIDSIRIEKKTL